MSKALRVGAFRFEPHRNLLLSEGASVRLEPMATEVLRYLAERADRVVTREELYEGVWGSTVVSDEVLAITVALLQGTLR